MLKKVMRSFAVASMSLLLSVGAYADGTMNADVIYNADNSQLIVSGDYIGGISVTLLPDGIFPENLSPTQLPVIFKQIDADGDFECAIGIPQNTPGGRYTAYIASKDGEIQYNIIHINAARVQALVEQLSAANGEDFQSLVSENALSLGIDTTDEVFVKNSEDILAMLDNMKYADANEFGNMYSKSYAFSMLCGADSDTAKNCMKKYQTVLGIDYGADFESDSRLNDSIRNEILLHIASVQYRSMVEKDGDVDFKSLLNEAKILAAVKNADNWMSLKNVITSDFKSDFDDMISSDSLYSKIVDKDEIFAQMMEYDLSSAENIENAFGEAVQYVYSAENKSSGSSGGSHGASSGGGFSGGYSPTPVTTPANPQQTDVLSPGFADVGDTHWGYEAVTLLSARGVISGYPDGSFKPDGNVTRAEFTKMISAFVDSEKNGEKLTFSDVSENDWYFDCVSKVSSFGIIKGDGTSFNPNNLIKREDAALIIYRILDFRGEKPLGHKPFADRNNISDYAKDAVYALGGAGIIQGSGDNMFMPKSCLTRAEAAQLIYNALYR